jgi:hypothetical protein
MRALILALTVALLPGTAAFAQSEAEDLAPADNPEPAPKPKPKTSSSSGPKRTTSSSSSQPRNEPATAQPVVYQSAGASSTPGGKQFGVGIQMGYPTALTLKYMLQPDQGLVGGIGAFSGFAYDRGSFTLFVDYVWHPHMLTSSEAFALTWYIGGGGQLIVHNNNRFVTGSYPVLAYYYAAPFWLAARMPIGANIALTQAPIEIYVEAIPGILVFPGLSFGIGASLGGRFYF